MSHAYRPVQWNRNKYVYDAVLVISLVLYIVIFLNIAPLFRGDVSPIQPFILRIRAFGSCAFLMLTLILCIGPLARLDPRFIPLLYNRRHFGVITSVIAFIHLSDVLALYFSLSPTPKFVAVLSSNTSFGQLLGFPFELFGVFAITLMIVLAVTSHDFWLSFLTPKVWKSLHMGIYLAYASLVAHVSLGYLQNVENPGFAVIYISGALSVTTLHVIVGLRENRLDREHPDNAVWIPVCRVDEIVDDRGRVVVLPDGERAAVFRYKGKVSAVSNLCAHQNGPLGEGRIVFGCITCPWHGFQYRPEDGCAPAPFTEKLPTYNVKIKEQMIMINPVANPVGTYVEPARFTEE